MSYVDKNDEEKKENEKRENPLKAIFAEDTQIETPEDIIKADTDENRKNAFKKAYDRIQGLFPEESDKKKKKKKSKEKEDFDRNLNVRTNLQQTQTRTMDKTARNKENDISKGIERE